jgi:hypothetical protein
MMGVRTRPTLLAFIICVAPACLWAQVVRLPAVEPPSRMLPGQLVSHPDSPAEILQSPGTTDAAPASPRPDESQLPPGVRNGVFQKVLVDATWLAPGSGDGLEIGEVRVEGIFALPCPTRNAPLVITPGFDAQTLEGPPNVEVPQRLFAAYTQFRWLSQVTPQWGLDFAVTPGAYSDFNQASNKAFRLTAHGAAAWTWNEQTKIAFGVAYLDMPDTNFIPIGGLIWTPNEELKCELVFPHPKIARRIYWRGIPCGCGILPFSDAARSRIDDDRVQDWVYMVGEFANDAWAIQQTAGANTQVLLRDYRFIVGVERKVIGGLSSRFEVGYVFGRRVRYTNDTPDYYPADTVMVRGGLAY